MSLNEVTLKRGRRSRQLRRRLELEYLEDRRLLSAFVNTLVNDPAEDGTSAQDTHSETALLVAGSTVLVGFNDSLSAGASKFTGLARSIASLAAATICSFTYFT